MEHISASIVIYKNPRPMVMAAVESFLSSVAQGTLYIIDNSPKKCFEDLSANPRIVYRFNNRNLGFGAAHNIALKHALQSGSDYHIVLNPDVYFEPLTVSKLFHYMQSQQEVGLVMPKILYPDGRLQPLCKLLPSPSTLFLRRFMQFHGKLLERMNHYYEMHFTGYDRLMDVPFLSGCFMFLRMDALRSVGLFDESIFLYTEDADLSRRIHKKYRTVFFPDATVFHHNGRGSYRNIVTLVHHILSAIRYFNKWGWFRDEERDNINERALLNFSKG